jgi:micrococcal nuclease
MSKQRMIRLVTSLIVFVALFAIQTFAARDTHPAVVQTPIVTSTQPMVVETVAISTTTNALVVRAVDGDTISVKIDGEKDEMKVRLLGVNTPESVDPRKPVECFGKEASKHTKEMTEGKRVRLDPDPQADEIDKYGRLLRNVVLEDGTDYNASLVRDGYAYAYLSFPLNKLRKVELANLQKEAEAAKRGLWDPNTCHAQK